MMSTYGRLALGMIAIGVIGSSLVRAVEPSLPGLKVSENRRFLVNASDNAPFFWLGDWFGVSGIGMQDSEERE